MGSICWQDFHDVHFTNNAWVLECRWYGDVNFNMSEVSNNHILARGKVKEQIHSIGPGDQVYLKGILVDYSIKMKNGSFNRATSLRRDDTGNGACEVFLVEKVVVLKSDYRKWQLIFHLALGSVFLFLILRASLFIFENSPIMMRMVHAEKHNMS